MKKFYIFVSLLVSFFLVGVLYSLTNNDKDIKKSNYLSQGQYIRFVYIGSSGCIYSNNQKTQKLIRGIKSSLNDKISGTKIKLITTGVSYDILSNLGIEHLEKTGQYDELLVGAGPLNLGILNYANEGLSTPKVILYFENYEVEPYGLSLSNFHNSQRLLGTYTGVSEINNLHSFVDSSSIGQIISHYKLDEI